MHVPALAVALALAEEDDVISAHSTATIATRSGTRDTVMPRTSTRSAQAAVAACRRAGPDTNPMLVEIGPEGWTPTQQPPEISPSLRSLPLGYYFYLREERKR
jgi:hypothetical protein